VYIRLVRLMAMMATVSTRLAAGFMAVLLATTTAEAADKPTYKALLDLASTYLFDFVERFSNVVAEEKYVQTWSTNSGVLMARRELRSDFLLTKPKNAGAWMTFRDVFEVDGAPVRDQEERLVELFLKPSPKAAEEISVIATESARYNLGNIQRTINQPLFGLILLQRTNQSRFTYSVDKNDKDVGRDVWIVQFKESARPTYVRGSSGKDLPSRGRVWIDSVNGHIMKTELLLEDNFQKAELTSTFRPDERFGISVPTEMKEQYSLKGNGGKIQGVATYQRFRRFEVRLDESVR
jgi:hypothetical protein